MTSSQKLLLGAAGSLLFVLTACGGQQEGLRVSFAYADNASDAHQPATGQFPKPWQGSSNVKFVGQGPKFDSGAIRIENGGDDAVTVQRIAVDIGSKQYALWGANLQVPAHGSLILTQTDPGPAQPFEPNFDTSEVTSAPGTAEPAIPVMHLTVNGRTTDVKDAKRILTTGGVDVGTQSGTPNESHAWAFAATVAPEAAGSNNGLDWTPVAAGLIALLSFLPALIGALLLLLLGWLLAKWLARLIALLLAKLGVDAAAERMGVVPGALHGPAHGERTVDYARTHPHRGSLSWLIGLLVGVFIFLIFLVAVSQALHLPQLAALGSLAVLFIPNLLVAILLLAIGLIAARALSHVVFAAAQSAGLPGGMLAMAVRGLVIAVAVVAALTQVGVGASIVYILFVGLCVALALTLGIAFGLGGEATAREILERWTTGRPGGRRVA